MSSNLDYLNPALQPLADTVQAYLDAEKELQRAEVEAADVPAQQVQAATSAQQFEQRPATGSFAQQQDEIQQNLQNLRDDLARLRQQVLDLLPVRDEWVKINLGYGPSRVGAFRTGTAPAPGITTPDGYLLRVVI